MLAPTDSLCKIAAALGPDEAIRGTLQIFGWSCRESYILGKILPGRLAGKTILKRDCTSTVEARNIALKTRGCIGFSFEGELKIDQELQKLQKIEELEKKQKPQKAIETNVKKSQLERRKKQLIELDQQTADEEPPIGSFIPAPFQKELEKVNKELTELQQQHDSEQKELDKELHRLKSTLDQELRKPLMQRIDELELATGSVNDGKIKALEKMSSYITARPFSASTSNSCNVSCVVLNVGSSADRMRPACSSLFPSHSFRTSVRAGRFTRRSTIVSHHFSKSRASLRFEAMCRHRCTEKPSALNDGCCGASSARKPRPLYLTTH